MWHVWLYVNDYATGRSRIPPVFNKTLFCFKNLKSGKWEEHHIEKLATAATVNYDCTVGPRPSFRLWSSTNALSYGHLFCISAFTFYKQRVLTYFWGRKDSVVGINKPLIAHSMCMAQYVTHSPLRLRLAQIGALFGSQNAILVKHSYTWEY